jgi:outer membrane receptor protein involved in Fe transport
MLMAACAALAIVPEAAQAQQSPQRVNYNIPAQDLGTALTELARQSNREIYFPADLARGKRAPRLSGKMTFEDALRRLLSGSGLRYHINAGGSVVIEVGVDAGKLRAVEDKVMALVGRDAEGRATIPDILVTGRRDWNLNLDIPRTADDAQPYVVFTRKDIQQSGATSLEDFFRANLGANNSGSNSTQTSTTKSQSVINLRGLGTASTLILVDGRRYAQANQGDGIFTQSSVNGIPLDAIERIEVLASSASGIYGSNAVGGVINIIMRRDFRGIEATAYYGNTSRLDAAEKRLSLNGSFPLEDGKTRVSFTGGWQRNDGLYEGERDYIARGRALLLANSPNYFSTITNPVAGATPNIVSTNGSNLVLKPQYGGTSLGARSTYIPYGFRGIAQDGVAALIANAGKQNFNLSPTVVGGEAGNGTLSPLITPTQNYSGSLTVRRDFNKWLSLYGEFGYTRYETSILTNPAAGTYTLPPNSIDNPFTQSISVSVPISTGNRTLTNVSTTKRALAGAIVKLPFGWQAAIDLNWNWSSYNASGGLPSFDKATNDGIRNGTISLLKDVSQYPVQFGYLDSPSLGLIRPSHSYTRSYTIKLAGPMPFLRLWGGKPIVTLLVEQDKQTQGDYVSFANSVTNSSISFTPKRSQRTDSAYGEVRFPIIGKDNHVPLIRELELQVAGRYDRYTGVGANTFLNCFPGTSTTFAGPLPASAYDAPCPQAGAQPVFATTRNSSINPTVALRWAVTEDIAFRGSYSTGYLPPYLNSVVSVDAGVPGTLLAGKTVVNVTDPLRGNEIIGEDLFGFLRILPARQGGNTNVDPQTSKSWSLGTIVTPRFLPGLRLSVDWSRITQNNVYFNPFLLVSGGNNPGGQQAFNDFLAANPQRFTRDTNPATFGQYKVGPIIFADITTANFSLIRSEAIDFAGSYDMPLGNGRLALQAAATWLRDLTLQTTPSAKPLQSAGVVSNQFLVIPGGAGGVAWKGNGSIVYTSSRWSLGVRGRYFGPYWFNTNHSVQPLQGTAKLGSQAYFDIFGTFRIFPKTELRGGVNNVFDRSPPINATTSTFYSFFGDPRRANFYVSVNQKF